MEYLQVVMALQRQTPKIVSNRIYRFALGVVVGGVIGAALLLTFSGNLPASGITSVILSVMTYGALFLIAFGYFYKKGGKKTFVGDFALGVGVGLIVIWFVNAGIANPSAIPLDQS